MPAVLIIGRRLATNFFRTNALFRRFLGILLTVLYIFCRLKVSKKESRPSKSASHVTMQKKSIGANFDDHEDDEGEEPFTENQSTQADSESTQTSRMDSLTSSLSMGISDAGFLYKRLKVFIIFENLNVKWKVKLHF